MQLNYKTFGAGDPLIILHGLFGTLDNWQTVARQLSDTFMVYIVDQRNHGRSPHVDHITYPAMAQDLHEFMASNWIHKAHVLGHSMGGKTAMQLAMDYPETIDKLLVVDIAPKAYEAGHNAIFEALLSVDLSKVSTRTEADAQLQAFVPEVGIRQFLLKNLTHDKENGAYKWKMNLPVIHSDYPKIIEGLDTTEVFEGETLFVRGGKSDYILPEDELQIKKYFPKAKIETIEQAGHWVHAEAPKDLLGLVRQFLG